MRTPSTGRKASWDNQRRAKSAQANCRRRTFMFHKPAVWAVAPILAIFLSLASTAAAQEVSTPKFEVGVNYSWLHVNSANFDRQRTGNGGSGYLEYNLSKTAGLCAGFGCYSNTLDGNNDKILT